MVLAHTQPQHTHTYGREIGQWCVNSKVKKTLTNIRILALWQRWYCVALEKIMNYVGSIECLFGRKLISFYAKKQTSLIPDVLWV